MLTLLAIVTLAQEIPQKYLDAARAIELPADLETWASRSSQHRKAVETIADRRVWARGLQLVDEKLGLFAAPPKIKVTVAEDEGPRAAKGGGRKGEGEVHFNLKKMAEYVGKVEDFERMRHAGKDVKFRVPPSPLATVIHHELTHCFAGTYDELWFTEGVAAWVAGEEAFLWDFQNRKAALNGLDRDVEEKDAYARGFCVFAWLVERDGAGSVKSLVARVIDKPSGVRKALEEATGLDWEKLVAQERAWAQKFLKRFTP